MGSDEYDANDSLYIPDVYVDRFRVTITVFGVNMTFGLSQPHPTIDGVEETPDVDNKVRLRMSLEHTKVVAMMLVKQLKTYEKDTGTAIALPEEILGQLGLDQESW